MAMVPGSGTEVPAPPPPPPAVTLLMKKVSCPACALLALADTTIHDSKHDSDALGWATFFQRESIVRLLETGAAS